MSKEIDETLILLNDWWKNSKVSGELAKPFKREMFSKIKKLMDYRQIVILSGLRRVGKTTIIYQMVEELLGTVNAKDILYFSFDKSVGNLNELFEAYERLKNPEWKNKKIYVFFDEITKLKDWANKLKLFYDKFPNLKLFISSSSSVNLEQEAVQSLSGRYFLVNAEPLNFTEFLKLKEKSNFLENIPLYEKEIQSEFGKYLFRSFPEIINWDDELLIKDYLRSTVLDKIIKNDLPERFNNINRDLLGTLVELFFNEPGMHLDYDSLSKTMRISKKTLIRHIFYLEFSYLIRKVKNFRPGLLASTRKMQRVYPFWWNLAFCYSANLDDFFENFVGSKLKTKNYWRDGGKEIDFLKIEGKKITPFEVKNKLDIQKSDFDNLVYFLEKYKLKKGFLIYSGKENVIKVDGLEIILEPFWKFALEKDLKVQ